MAANAPVDANAMALDPKAERRRQKEEAKRAKADAKANVKGKKGKKEKKGRKFLVTMIVLPVILAGVLITVLVLNPLNLRDGLLAPVLLRVPVLRDFVQLYEYQYMEVDGEFILVAVPVEPYLGPTQEELAAEVSRLNTGTARLQAEISRLEELNRVYMQRINELDTLVRDQEVFDNERAAFETQAANAAPEVFIRWFDSFDPERAASIFGDVIRVDAQNQLYRDYFNRILAMEESSVAEALEEMIPVHTPMVVAIVQGLTPAFAGEVLSEMEPVNAALIMRQMYPVRDFFDLDID